MNQAIRKAVIAGNWKMNMTPSKAKEAVEKTAALVKGKDGCTFCRKRRLYRRNFRLHAAGNRCGICNYRPQ